MKKLIAFILILLCCQARAQQPVEWSSAASKISKGVYEVRIKARLQKPWHIYSAFMDEGGPVPTKLNYNGPSLKPLTKIKENGTLKTSFEPVFNINVKYFEDSVTFVQKVAIKDPSVDQLSGAVDYMLCNNRQCLPPSKWLFFIGLK